MITEVPGSAIDRLAPAAARIGRTHSSISNTNTISPRRRLVLSKTVITSNPAIKKIGDETIVFASSAVGVQKLRLTGKGWNPSRLASSVGLKYPPA